MSIGTWFTTEEQQIAAWFSNEEATLVKFFGPLFNQILATAVTVGKGDVAAGLQVLTDAATTAVAAGAAAAVSGGNPVQAAETTFVSTATTEGVTAIHNAESGLIKAGVAIAQSAATDLAATVNPTSAAPVAPPAAL
jgi:hypothetical protein